MKTILKTVFITLTVVATLFFSCVALMSGGQNAIDGKGAELAQATGWTMAGCNTLEESKRQLCKSAVNQKRLEASLDDLDAFSDAVDRVRP